MFSYASVHKVLGARTAEECNKWVDAIQATVLQHRQADILKCQHPVALYSEYTTLLRFQNVCPIQPAVLQHRQADILKPDFLKCQHPVTLYSEYTT